MFQSEFHMDSLLNRKLWAMLLQTCSTLGTAAGKSRENPPLLFPARTAAYIQKPVCNWMVKPFQKPCSK